jgi:hypothetical protein
VHTGRQGSNANRWSRTTAQQSLGILHLLPFLFNQG